MKMVHCIACKFFEAGHTERYASRAGATAKWNYQEE